MNKAITRCLFVWLLSHRFGLIRQAAIIITPILFLTACSLPDKTALDGTDGQTYTVVDSADEIEAVTEDGAEMASLQFVVYEVLNAEAYKLEISTSNSFSGNPVYINETLSSNIMNITALLNSELTYYWRAAAKKDGKWGKWTAGRSFTLGRKDSGNDALNGMSPANGSSTSDTTPTFSWTTVEGADKYQIQIAGSEAKLNDSPAIDVEVSDTNYTTGEALTNLQTYYWRMRALNGDEEAGTWSVTYSLRIEFGAAISGLSPADGSSISDTMPAFSWNSVEGADKYQIQIADSEAELGSSSSVDVEVSGTDYTPVTKLTNLNTHYWRVRALSGDGQTGTWSATHSLLMRFGMGINGLSPADGSTTTDTTPAFGWNAVDGADEYQIQIADSEAELDSSPAVDVTGTVYTLETALTNFQTHYWRVRALNGSNQAGSWSAAYSLGVEFGATINGLSPANGSTMETAPAFEWDAVSGADKYQIQIADSEAKLDSNPDVNVEVNETEYTHGSTLTNLQTYYWRVRALNGNGQAGAWSETHSLRIEFGAAISGLSPADGSTTTDTMPAFSWNAVSGANKYQIQIAGSETELGSSSSVDAEVTGTEYTHGSALANLQTHYWRVRALNGSNQAGDWSATHSLQIEFGAAISGLGPTDGSTTADTTPTFVWTNLDGADKYQIQIADSEAELDGSPDVDVAGTVYTLETALTNFQTYYWRVRALDGSNQAGDWSAAYSLGVEFGAAINGLSPADGSNTAETSPAFGWNAVNEADRYQIQIADSESELDGSPAVDVTGTNYTPGSSLKNLQTHYWRVRALNGDGQAGVWSETYSLRIEFGAVINGLSPADGSNTLSTTPSFNWNAVSGANKYQIQIAGSEAELSSSSSIGVEVTGTEYTPAAALTNLQTHYWRVRALNGSNQAGDWSATHSLRIEFGAAINGLSPADGSTTADTTPTFVWTNLDGADKYQIQIAGSKAELDGSPAVDVTGTVYTLETALTNFQTHYWRVRALDGSNQAGDWSAAYSLGVEFGAAINGLSPDNGFTTTDTTPAFGWNAVSGADRYQIQIAGSKAELDGSPDIDVGVTGTGYTHGSALTNLQTHYWRVRALSNGQAGAWSETHSLGIEFGAAINGLSPADRSTTTDTTPAFGWTTVNEADRYQIQIADSESELDGSPAVDVTGTNYTPGSSLKNLQTHYWRVRALNGDGQAGVWSETYSLRIEFGAAINGLSPADGFSTTDTTPAFGWNAVSGANKYQIQIEDSEIELSNSSDIYAEVTGTDYTPVTALTNLQMHYWRVRALNSDGQAGAWSEAHSLRTTFGVTINGLSPADGFNTTDTTPAFGWTTVNEADRYQIQIADSESELDGSPAVDVTGTNYTPGSSLKNLQTHYWRVRALNGDGQAGVWSETYSLGIEFGAAINGLSPADGFSTTDTTPAFGWNAVSGANKYQIQIEDSEIELSNSSDIYAEVTGTDYTPVTALTNLQMHYWRVRALNSDGQAGAWSTAHSLRTTFGVTINGLSPADGFNTTDTTPAFGWTTVNEADRYQIQIADSESELDGSPAVDVTGTNYTPGSSLKNLQTHYWRVRALNGDGQAGVWSETYSLGIEFGAAINGLSPADGFSTTDTTPAFGWTTVSGADKYQIQIADSEAELDSSPAVDVTGTNYTPGSALTNLQTHYWRVRALNSDGQAGAWSTAHSLRIEFGAAMSGLNPADGSTTTDTTPAFGWTTVSGADRYQIQIADSESELDGSPAVDVTGTNYTPVTALANLHTHYWRVRALNAKGQTGAWSEAYSLRTEFGAAMNGLSPADNSTTADTTPTFSWNTVKGADKYQLQIANSEADLSSSSAVNVEVTAANYTHGLVLTNLYTHYWRVRALNSDGQAGAWSAIHSLQIQYTLPTDAILSYDNISVREGKSKSRTPQWSSSGFIVTYSMTPLNGGTLPDDISINPETGTITVGPSAAVQAYTAYQITAAGTGNWTGLKKASIIIRVNEQKQKELPTDAILSYDNISVREGGSKSRTPQWSSSGFTVTYSMTPLNGGTLPDGISINPETGTITVGPSAAVQAYTAYQITAAGTGNWTGLKKASIIIRVNEQKQKELPTDAILSYDNISVREGRSKSRTPQWSSSGFTVTYSMTPLNGGTLPDGISINPETGTITVGPSAAVQAYTAYQITAAGTGNWTGLKKASIIIRVNENK